MVIGVFGGKFSCRNEGEDPPRVHGNKGVSLCPLATPLAYVSCCNDALLSAFTMLDVTDGSKSFTALNSAISAA